MAPKRKAPRREYGLHLVGKIWHCEFTAAGVYIHRSTKRHTYDDALQVAKAWHDEATDQGQGLLVASDVDVDDLLKRWVAWAKVNLSEKHVKTVTEDWRDHVLPVIGGRKAKTITDAQAEEIRTRYLDGPSRRNAHYGMVDARKRTVAGANRVSKNLRLVFSWGVKLGGVLPRVPFRVHMRRADEIEKQLLRREQVRKFLDAVDQGSSLHLKVATRIMLMLGLREHEALTLAWSAFREDLTEVTPPNKTKKAKAKPVPLELQQWLRKLDGCEDREGLVLPGPDGDPHPAGYTRPAMRRGGAAVGLYLTPHNMRASLGTMAARAGAGAHLIKDLLRHDLVETSQHYVDLGSDDIAALQDQIFGTSSQKSLKMAGRKVVKLAINHHKNNKSSAS